MAAVTRNVEFGAFKSLALLRLLSLALGLSDSGLLGDADLLALLRRLRTIACLLTKMDLLALLLSRLGTAVGGLFSYADLLGLLVVLMRALRRRWAIAGLLGDADLFVMVLLRGLRTTETLFFVDADLLLDLSVVVGSVARCLDGGREGFVRFFVTFPSV